MSAAHPFLPLCLRLVLSCLVLSCLVLSGVLSCLVLSCFAFSCGVLSGIVSGVVSGVVSCRVSCFVVSCRVVSYRVVSYTYIVLHTSHLVTCSSSSCCLLSVCFCLSLFVSAASTFFLLLGLLLSAGRTTLPTPIETWKAYAPLAWESKWRYIFFYLSCRYISFFFIPVFLSFFLSYRGFSPRHASGTRRYGI